MEGWIKLHRAIQSNDLWTSEPFSRGQAWVDLLLLANHKESFFYKRGNKVIINRGQVGRSEVELSDRWKWSRTKVRKFLKDLEKEQQVKIFKSRITQVLTIVNYDVYQQKEQQTGQQKDNKKTAEEQQKDIYKNEEKEKKDKNEEKKYPYIANFQKIKKGESVRVTQLEKNFHFGLFPPEWSENFQNEILKFWRYMESKKSDRWGVIGTISSQLSVIKSYLNDFSESEIIKTFNETVSKSNISWNPAWTLKRAGTKSEKDSTPKKFTYDLPEFLDAEDRQSYFYVRYNSYKPFLDLQKVNTIYKQRALREKDAEGLCFELELINPKLAAMQIQYNRLT